jgi:porphobilinogen synthase
MNADRRTADVGRVELAPEAPAAAPGAYPTVRMRRNRRDAWTRRLVAENALTTDDLIWPVFVMEGRDAETPVASMPGQVRVTVDRLAEHVERAAGSASRRSRCSP